MAGIWAGSWIFAALAPLLSNWTLINGSRMWSLYKASNRKSSAVSNSVPTVTKCCGFPPTCHKIFKNEGKNWIGDRRLIINRSLIHRASWSTLIKASPVCYDWSTSNLLNDTKLTATGIFYYLMFHIWYLTVSSMDLVTLNCITFSNI